jgi:hypothetical protein
LLYEEKVKSFDSDRAISFPITVGNQQT